ncbi:hypothetical protein DAC15_131 [Bacteroides phage DAC15]|nr:hypothetical protein KNU90_gp002 [Bacteroides phage DAC15]YP_010106358.1 hypothetical protein KNU90_gp010 [Bacteroides phage DAC15]QIN96193.1 hypothetical protein DAC15_2 [Bacteroides phage DAC15]QIN96308.1 hypothetical protein DAC15_131 [Bacteroides phage DAC15]
MHATRNWTITNTIYYIYIIYYIYSPTFCGVTFEEVLKHHLKTPQFVT